MVPTLRPERHAGRTGLPVRLRGLDHLLYDCRVRAGDPERDFAREPESVKNQLRDAGSER